MKNDSRSHLWNFFDRGKKCLVRTIVDDKYQVLKCIKQCVQCESFVKISTTYTHNIEREKNEQIGNVFIYEKKSFFLLLNQRRNCY